jgi:bis(5'-nucleosyl)-tetraphosphatase (symmetrical)
MATYAVGDLQGCLQPLQCLLQEVNFDRNNDTLWVVGDLVNRGPQSLETLRFIKSLDSSAVVVLGNHDLHLLAIYYGVRNVSKSLQEVISAPDVDELMLWLRQQPLLHVDEKLGYAMSHAGLLPTWSIEQAQNYSDEVSAQLQGKKVKRLLQKMYGNSPKRWRDELKGMKRYRAIINAFTRMRFCTASGKLDFDASHTMEPPGPKYKPWFQFPNSGRAGYKFVFGHWAVLAGRVDVPDFYGLDTGCVWGREMTMMRLDDGQTYTCQCGDEV